MRASACPRLAAAFATRRAWRARIPRIWQDIFTSNADALASEIDRSVARLQEAAALIRAGDADAVEAWQSQAQGARDRLLEAGAIGGAHTELRVTVENKPGVVAEIALALGREGVNIEDMALQPAADMRTGAISLWVAGEGDAARAVEVMRELGHSASAAGSSA